MRGTRELKRAGRWLRSRLVSGGLILLYHRVAAPAHDPFRLCVSPDHFAAQMAWLRGQATPLPLGQLVNLAQTGQLPRRAVAVTFDDGYLDNLTEAKPVLEAYQIPATVFVATGYLGKPFWWDQLAQIVLETRRWPKTLWWPSDNQPLWRGSAPGPREKHRLLERLHARLQELSPGEREKALAYLVGQLDEQQKKPVSSQALQPAELVELAGVKLIEIGAHTVTHPRLAAQPKAVQARELQDSKRRLEEILTGETITAFSYPFGLAADYSSETKQLVQKTGFKLACAAHIDLVWRGSDSFQLPRFWVQDWSARQFGQNLKRWLP